jgi:hypothetical protein
MFIVIVTSEPVQTRWENSLGECDGDMDGLSVGGPVLLAAVSHPSSQSAWPSLQQL